MTDSSLLTSIDPAGPVIAGMVGTWRLTCTSGGEGLAAGSVIRVGTDSDTDWGVPQFDDPAAAEYATVVSPEGVDLAIRTVGVKGFQLELGAGGLPAGQSIEVVLGDTSGGSPGSRAQTFRETSRVFHVTVDPGGTGAWTHVEGSPQVAIIGGDPVALVVVAPSEVPPGEPFRVLVKAEDRWGNASNVYRGTVSLDCEGIALDQQPRRSAGAGAGAGFGSGQYCCRECTRSLPVMTRQTCLARATPFAWLNTSANTGCTGPIRTGVNWSTGTSSEAFLRMPVTWPGSSLPVSREMPTCSTSRT